MTKSEQRAFIREKRDKMSRDEVAKGSAKICEKLLQLPTFDRVMVYLAFGAECDIGAYISYLMKYGKKVYVPVCTGKGIMEASLLLNAKEDLECGTFGIMAPKKSAYRFIDPIALDAVIVPGVAFDKNGGRLGFGGGFYDRYLPKTRKDCPKIAVCYDFQLLDDVYPEAHDFTMEHIITESAVYDIV